MKRYSYSLQHFRNYIASFFPLHADKILKAETSAKQCKILYPFLFFLIPFLFTLIFGFFLSDLKAPILENLNENFRVSGPIIEETSLDFLINFVYYTGIFISILCAILGFFVGLNKAQRILFQSENLEMQLRQTWFIEVLTNDIKPSEAITSANKETKSSKMTK